jgi:hypothetical protein
VGNLHHEHEADASLHALLRERIGAQDRLLADVLSWRDRIFGPAGLDERLDALVLVARERHREREGFGRRSGRRVHACFALRTRDRHRLAHTLLRRLWPLM